MMETAHKKRGSLASILAAYFLIYVVWGSTYFFIGVALSDFPPFLLGALRFMVAGLILLAICYWRGEKVFRKKLIGRSAITGIILLFVDMAVVMLAQRYVTSSFVAIIASSTALWILLLDVPMWKTNFRSWLTLSGAIIGLAGVAEHMLMSTPSSPFYWVFFWGTRKLPLFRYRGYWLSCWE